MSGKAFKVSHNHVVGRHLVATRDIHPGEVIIDELPIILGPATESSSSDPVCPVCCAKVKSSPFPCVSCALIHCSQECSSKDLHRKNECGVFAKLPPFFLDPKYLNNLVLTIRCIWKRLTSPGHDWVQIHELQSNLKSLEKIDLFVGLDVYFQQLSWTHFGVLEDDYEHGGGTWNIRNLEDMYTLSKHCLARMCTNSFSLVTPTVALEGMYFLSSLMSHSCLPNTDRQILSNGRMVTKASVAISKGQEITTTYLNPWKGTLERWHMVRSTWFFTCLCDRCTDTSGKELGLKSSSMLCSGCGECSLGAFVHVDSRQVHWACWENGCDRFDIADALMRLRLIEKSRPPMDDIVGLEKWIMEQEESNFLHPHHSIFIEPKLYLSQYYGRKEGVNKLDSIILRRKLSHCKDVVHLLSSTTAKTYEGIFILVGIIWFEYWLTLREFHRRDMLTEIYEGDEKILLQEAHDKALKNLQFSLTDSNEMSMLRILQEENAYD